VVVANQLPKPDRPVRTAAASYAAVLGLVWQAVEGLDDAKRPEVVGGSAARVYGPADADG
jgi:hypothetical protein